MRQEGGAPLVTILSGPFQGLGRALCVSTSPHDWRMSRADLASVPSERTELSRSRCAWQLKVP